ncbi:MAG: MATE family efflux transporter [Rhizobiaceae bacterium]|nr:MATE family efflux transporter [Rhizobiaceae bacterium]
MTSNEPAENRFLTGPLPRLFVGTALPIILIMGTNGLLTVVDAYFLGEFVGAEALAAVTLMFPLYMLMTACATLVSGGMASVLARQLGAGHMMAARRTFVAAQCLALIVCVILIGLFALGGWRLALLLADGSVALAASGYAYISLLVWFSPLAFILAINSDALRCEGRLGFMTLASLTVSLTNVAFNYLLIVVLDFGVVGSAAGTVLAQVTALAAIIVYRSGEAPALRLRDLAVDGWNRGWSRFLALGAPQSLSFVGIALGSTAIIAAVQMWNSDSYAATVAAYGIITRLLTFTFLPMLGLSMAAQTVIGNNFGAGLWHRSDAGLKLALGAALTYAGIVQLVFWAASGRIGFVFVDDPETAGEVARVLPVMTAMYALAGPQMILAGYFQAIGDAGRAAILSLTRTYVFAIPLTFILPSLLGERGIWIASPASEAAMIAVATVVLWQARASTGHRYGLFRATRQQPVSA